jgi:hypothetical protein
MKFKPVVMTFLAAGLMLAAASLASARGNHFYEKGTLKEMNGVNCGWDQHGAMSVPGILIGTDDQHTKTKQMVCQEYTLEADHITYHIRPKDDKHPRLLPVGETAEFRIVKDRMYLRVPESDDKEHQFLVVSAVPNSDENDKTAKATGSEKK